MAMCQIVVVQLAVGLGMLDQQAHTAGAQPLLKQDLVPQVRLAPLQGKVASQALTLANLGVVPWKVEAAAEQGMARPWASLPLPWVMEVLRAMCQIQKGGPWA